jgi:hypothetical protein
VALAAATAAFVASPALGAAPGCGVTASALSGAAPFSVTFSAACASTSYVWDFGDGTQATGQVVQHAFAAGSWAPTLTTDVGAESAPPVASISLAVTGPPRARYAQWVTLHARVVPAMPVQLGGRRFDAQGRLRVRVLGPITLTATAGGVAAAPVHIQAVPTITVETRGAPVVGGSVHIVATLHPAHAGTVLGPRRIDTHRAHVAHLVLRSKPAAGWLPATASVDVSVVQPRVVLGDRGASVRALENRLAKLHYAVKRDGFFGSEDLEAVYAFEKVEGLPRTGAVDARTWARLEHAHTPRARYGGNHVEIDKTRQVLFLVRKGKVSLVVATSTGATGNTPLGRWNVYRKVAGFDWVLYYPSYFLRGFAVHGYPDVPPYPASHGCARIPMWIAPTVYDAIPDGSVVYVYT